MKRKAQVPMLMLFLVALVLTIATLFAFTLADRKFGDGSLVMSRAVSSVEIGESYVISSSKLMAKQAILSGASNVGSEFQRIANARRDLGVREAGTFFKVVGEGNFEFAPLGRNYLLKIGKSDDLNKKIILNAKSGIKNENEVTRYIVICMMFDEKGNYLGLGANKALYEQSCK